MWEGFSVIIALCKQGSIGKFPIVSGTETSPSTACMGGASGNCASFFPCILNGIGLGLLAKSRTSDMFFDISSSSKGIQK